MINFDLTDEQKAMQKMAREYAEKVIRPASAEHDEAETDPIELFRDMIAQGFPTMTFPEELGGSGADELTAVIVAEQIAWGCAGIAGSGMLNTPLGAYPILFGGNEEQKKRFIPPLSKDKFISFCLTEPNAGSDAGSVQTSARREGDYYVLNGSKCFITNGGFADIYTVFATVDRSRGTKGLTAFVVEKGTPGLSTGKKEKKMGIRASNTSEVIFDDVKIPVENRIGEEGKGFGLAMKTLDFTRPMIAALAVGIAQAAYETALQYVKERVQFGKPLSHFQVTQFKLANMLIEIEAARLLVWKCAFLAGQHSRSFSVESAICKTFAGDMAMRITTEAVQMLGGYGYSREYPVEKFMRDAKITQIYEGTNEIQRIVIANNILR